MSRFAKKPLVLMWCSGLSPSDRYLLDPSAGLQVVLAVARQFYFPILCSQSLPLLCFDP